MKANFLLDLPSAPKTYGDFPLVNLPVCPLWARVNCAAKVCELPRCEIDRLIREKLIRVVWRQNATGHFLPIVYMPSLLAYLDGLPSEKDESLAEPALAQAAEKGAK
jgi:hypothetical protein